MKNWLYIYALVNGVFLWSQPRADSAIALSEIRVQPIPIGEFSVGHVLDSLKDRIWFNEKQNFLGQNLASQTGIAVREYGAGNIASVSYRGLSANHTGLYWEGIPLNSLLLGQFDYNTISGSQFSEIDFRRGGSSALGGSGAVGGSIHLSRKLEFNRAFKGSIGHNVGSFGFTQSMLDLGYSNENFSIDLNGQYTFADNDYPFTNNQGNSENRQNSALSQWSGLAQVGFKPLENQLIKFSVWSNNNGYRNYAGAVGSTQNSRLENPLLLASLLYSMQSKQSRHTAQLAYSQEDYNFFNNRSTNASPQTSRVLGKIARYEWKYFGIKAFQIRVGALGMLTEAEGENYDRAEREDVNFFLSINHQIGKWLFGLNLNKGFSSDFQIPFTLDAGVEFKSSLKHRFYGNFTTNYRVPTLNDLYFQPGGNADVVPEEGWMAEWGYEFKSSKGHVPNFMLGVFYGDFDKFIEWIPNAFGVFSPINRNQVETYGLEFSTDKKWNWGKVELGLRGNYAYTISRLNAMDAQRNYVPKHKAFLAVGAEIKNWQFSYDWMYSGAIPIRNDDSAFLETFQLHDLHLGYNLEFQNTNARLLFSLKNVWNKEYQTFAAHPMPGRNFNFQIQINLNN